MNTKKGAKNMSKTITLREHNEQLADIILKIALKKDVVVMALESLQQKIKKTNLNKSQYDEINQEIQEIKDLVRIKAA